MSNVQTQLLNAAGPTKPVSGGARPLGQAVQGECKSSRAPAVPYSLSPINATHP